MSKFDEQPLRVHADHPPFMYADYKSTIKRAVTHAPIAITPSISELTGPGPCWAEQHAGDADLTRNAGTGQPALGERILLEGRVLDEAGRPLPRTLVEIWQANASGRYRHWRETAFPAPIDPNFRGVGHAVSDDEGVYRFTTIRPGAYPWGNHANAWRPSHIHFSLLGPSLGMRLTTQMYFPGDPLIALDPIIRAVPEHARGRLIGRYDHGLTQPNWALGYRFDIVLRGPRQTPFERAAEAHASHRSAP
jgi:protocatechuate 3,4-dioxygenase beta subunit